MTRAEAGYRVVETFTGKCARCHRELPAPGRPLRVGKWIDSGWAAELGALLVVALALLAFASTVASGAPVWLALVALVVGVVGTLLIIRNYINHGGD